MHTDPTTYRLDKPGKTGTIALLAGLLGMVLCALAYAVDAERFFHAYLVAFAFWLAIGLGALFFVMLHHLTGAVWSVVIRRIAESLMTPLPLMAVFFVPILFGSRSLFPWLRPEPLAADSILQGNKAYLTLIFFLARASLYFAIWFLLTRSLWRASLQQDAGHTLDLIRRFRRISAVGMILLTFTATFATIDWLMSLDPHWYSTVFGVYYGAGAMLAAVVVLTVLALYLRTQEVLRQEITVEHYHDLGKLMFAFMILWAYMSFSQYFLIWYANIPEETEWFKHRWTGIWKPLSLIVVVGHFGIPFLALMSRPAKRNLAVLAFFSLWLLLMRWLDLYWIVMPTLETESSSVSWIDIPPMLAIGGIFVWFAWRQFAAHPVVPVGDPNLAASKQFINVY